MSWGCTLHCNHPADDFFFLSSFALVCRLCVVIPGFGFGALLLAFMEKVWSVGKAQWGSHVLWQHLVVAGPSCLFLGVAGIHLVP